MATISTRKYKIKDIEYLVKYKCDSSGKFYTKLSRDFYIAIGLDENIFSDNLNNLVKKVEDAITKYKKADIINELVICIGLNVGGRFCKKEDGKLYESFEYNPIYIKGKYIDSSESYLNLSYEILIRRVIDGSSSFFKVIKKTEVSPQYADLYGSVGEYVCGDIVWPLQYKNKKIIPYSDYAINSLKEIDINISRACNFLAVMISSDHPEDILISNNVNKLLENK